MIHGGSTLRPWAGSQVAAFSHSTTLGRRQPLPRHAAEGRASYHEKPATGRAFFASGGRPMSHPTRPAITVAFPEPAPAMITPGCNGAVIAASC